MNRYLIRYISPRPYRKVWSVGVDAKDKSEAIDFFTKYFKNFEMLTVEYQFTYADPRESEAA